MSTRWVCPACGRTAMSANDLCSGGFLDEDHPSNVVPVVGAPPVQAEPEPEAGADFTPHHLR